MEIKLVLLAFLAALPISLVVANFTEKISHKLIKTIHYYMSILTGKTHIFIDKDGLPSVQYGYVNGVYLGIQRNPVMVSQAVIDYFKDYERGDVGKKDFILNCANWLVQNATPYHNGDTLIFEYKFPYIYDMVPPWRSGLAQGLAVQAMIRAHKLTGDKKYLDAATKFLKAFFYEVAEKGVTYKLPDGGWWYEEYAHENGKHPWILNGMIFALIAIHEFYEYTGSPEAKELFDRGMKALKANIHRYDYRGYYSYYDILGKIASEKYHQIHIILLERLYRVSPDEFIKKYHDKWSSYYRIPFAMRLFKKPITKMKIAIWVLNFALTFLILLILMAFIE